MAEEACEAHQSKDRPSEGDGRIDWPGAKAVARQDADKEYGGRAGNQRQPMTKQNLKKNGEAGKK